MTISIWRYSHLTMAISSAIFIFIASVTGIILAFEPISNQLKPHNQVDLETVSIAETIIALQKEYDEVVSFSVDENDFVKASVITKYGKSASFYINPKTGKKVGELIQKAPIFEFATNLHRSLFLKSTGRFLVGFFSFLLFLISITGVILIAKRQGGYKKIFTKIVKENFHQYYHVSLGRWFLIPIIIITLTGVYLSLEKFSWLPKDKKNIENFTLNPDLNKIELTSFAFFKTTNLNDVKKVEFPFSDDVEDYFYVTTLQEDLAIHQFTGQIINRESKGFINTASNYSLALHTGQGLILWSVILLISCIAILFFMISGFSISLKRKKKLNKKSINIFEKDDAEYIILVGSETGSTYRFATAFCNSLILLQKKVYITELNNYTTFKNAKQLILFVATYGDGDAPANATNFFKKLQQHQPEQEINYSIVGFGSTSYKAFCKFAINLDDCLKQQKNFNQIIPLHTINNQSFSEFDTWLKAWKKQYNLDFEIQESDVVETLHQHKFKVIQKTELNCDDTFLIELKPSRKLNFVSGDLLSIVPPNEKLERLYSIAKQNKHILLSIKKHELGICSNFLNNLSLSDSFKATIKKNEKFHFPSSSKEVLLIANGTGIAPFLGMISENPKTKIHLFWGGRTKKSFELYASYIDDAKNKGTLSTFEMALSQETSKKIYVQDVVLKHKNLVADFLKSGNSILICGSLAMQRGIEKTLDEITQQLVKSSLQKFKENNQIKTDCY